MGLRMTPQAHRFADLFEIAPFPAAIVYGHQKFKPSSLISFSDEIASPNEEN
jgi:hypothetical protein